MICALKIATGQVAYLKVLIEEYWLSRKETFPDSPLKPKHNYLSCYTDLTIHFGRYKWPLQFETKHTYFKHSAHKLHNFKNLCSTLAERQGISFYQLTLVLLYPPNICCHWKRHRFFVQYYSDKIQESAAPLSFQLSNTLAAHEVSVKERMCFPGEIWWRICPTCWSYKATRLLSSARV